MTPRRALRADGIELPLTRSQMITREIFKFLEGIGRQPGDIHPEVMAMFEARLDGLLSYETVMTELALDDAQKEARDLKEDLTAMPTYEEYARDITYRYGVNDGIQQARSMVLQHMDDDELKAVVEDTIPSRPKSPLVDIEDVYFGPE